MCVLFLYKNAHQNNMEVESIEHAIDVNPQNLR